MSDLQKAVSDLERCRLCLNIAIAKISIFTDDFAKMIEILTSLKVRPSDSLPKISCLKCAKDVKTAFLLRRRIIQSHRVLTSKLNQLSSARRLTVNRTNIGASIDDVTSDETLTSAQRSLQQLQNTVDSSVATESSTIRREPTVDTRRPLQENITESSATTEPSMSASDSSLLGDEPKSNSDDEIDQINDSSSFNQESLQKNNVMSNMPKENTLNNSITFHADLLPSEKSKTIQDLKLTINTKYSNILNSYKQKLITWRLMDEGDQLNILKWLEKKHTNKKSLNMTTKHAPPTLLKKKEPTKLYCNTCQIKFTNKITYKNHMTRHRHKSCPICKKQVRSAYLKKHMTLHEDSPAMCEVCGITCKNPVSLKMHFFYYHKSNLSICEDCGRSFKTKTKLLYHRRKDHTKERNYKCDTCGKCFFAKIYLTKHVNMKHMKLRPHICEYCGKGFSGKHALRTHIRQHTNEAPFQCNLCGERFRQRVSLRGHLKSRHKVEEESKVFCDFCGKGFATAVALDVHSRLHKEIKCLWCSDTFAEKMYMDQHIAVVHANASCQENEGVNWMDL